MGAKYKHNKKQNVAFLYEILVRELSKSILEKRSDVGKSIASIIKEFFPKGSILNEQLGLYSSIIAAKGFEKQNAEKMLSFSKQAHDQLDKEKLKTNINALQKKISKTFKNDITNNFIPNYRILASISQVFSSKTPPRTRVLLEKEIIEYMSSSHEEKKQKINLEHIDSLTYKTFIKKFNEKYGTLLPEQINLLKNFIFSFKNNTEYKVFLNEEVSVLKQKLQTLSKLVLFQENSDLKLGLEKTINLFESFKNNQDAEKMLEIMLKTYELIKEFKDEH